MFYLPKGDYTSKTQNPKPILGSMLSSPPIYGKYLIGLARQLGSGELDASEGIHWGGGLGFWD